MLLQFARTHSTCCTTDTIHAVVEVPRPRVHLGWGGRPREAEAFFLGKCRSAGKAEGQPKWGKKWLKASGRRGGWSAATAADRTPPPKTFSHAKRYSLGLFAQSINNINTIDRINSQSRIFFASVG